MSFLSWRDLEKLTAQLKRHEGTKRDARGLHIAYRCTARALTIGYGHNLDANPVPGISATSRLNEDQAERLLIADIQACETLLAAALPWARELDPERYAVLINMTFNLGIRGLLSFRNTLRYIEFGDYHKAAANMMASKWAFQVGDGPGGRFDRAEELSRQMESGQWQR